MADAIILTITLYFVIPAANLGITLIQIPINV